jgi:hypothetical protein
LLITVIFFVILNLVTDKLIRSMFGLNPVAATAVMG